MSGLYPEDETIDVFGEQIKFPGLDVNGKYTNGDFSNPNIPPSRLDARTINLIIDNLNSLISKLGETPNNTGLDQLAALFTAAAFGNKGIMRDAHGRAQVSAPNASEDIARKAEVDAEASTRALADAALQGKLDTETRNRSSADSDLSSAINSHIGKTNNPHNTTKGQVGLGNCDNTADSQKSVYYANSAGSAGNADTVDNYHAGTSAGCLTPIVAFNFSSSSGYIKWGNGFIWQFASYKSDSDVGDTVIMLPLSFAATTYKQFVVLSDGLTYSGDGNSVSREMLCSIKVDAQRVKVRRIAGSNGCSVFAFGF